ncbi:MAG: signal peptidase I [Ruminococcus sp.]|nr:signal peptidase I [Ruminococcus sp.]
MGASGRISRDKALRALLKCLKGICSFIASLVIVTAAVVVVLYICGIRPYVVVSPSMEPAIPVRSVCFVNERTPLEEVKVGEVISFEMSDGMPATHRVVSIDGGEYTTKGDANQTEDNSPVTKDNYIGKTVVVIPKVGVLLSFLHRPAGIAAAGGIIALLLVLSFVPDKKKSEGESAESPEQEKTETEAEERKS